MCSFNDYVAAVFDCTFCYCVRNDVSQIISVTGTLEHSYVLTKRPLQTATGVYACTKIHFFTLTLLGEVHGYTIINYYMHVRTTKEPRLADNPEVNDPLNKDTHIIRTLEWVSRLSAH